MKTITFALSALFSVCIVVACTNVTDEDKTDNEVIDMHTSELSIDWAGYYYGELPCASCAGIKTGITLKNDGTYEKVEEFLGQNSEPQIVKGKIRWLDDKNKILLDDVPYFIAENSLVQLSANGSEITEKIKSSHILNKSKKIHDSSKNSQELTYEYKGSDGHNYQVIFNTNVTPPTALVQTANKEVIELLKQTEASAKTAIYENGNATLDMKGNTGILKRKGKVIKLNIIQ